MRRLARFSLTVGAVVFFAGCNGSQPPIAAPGAVPPTSGVTSARAGVPPVPLASSFHVLHSFKGGKDGATPAAGLTNVAGTLYGTTSEDGDGAGTVFAVSTSRNYRVIYRFKGYPADAGEPQANFTDVDGTLYSTSYGGGQSANGTVYKITTSRAERVLYSFKGYPDGSQPLAGLTRIGDTFYGTTSEGGTVAGCCGSGAYDGTVFKISCRSATCTETVLHDFAGYPTDGTAPSAGLTNVGGTFYGTTQFGGAYGGPTGDGTIFKLVCDNRVPCKETVLHNFSGTDGVIPVAGLTDVDGTLYGTTVDGGAYGGGTVFKITTSGVFNRIHSFAGSPDGWGGGGLTNVRGTLYGVTQQGGAYGCGTIFKITTSGREHVRYSFACYSDPLAGLTDVHGTLYGTTPNGGTAGTGTVFSFSP